MICHHATGQRQQRPRYHGNVIPCEGYEFEASESVGEIARAELNKARCCIGHSFDQTQDLGTSAHRRDKRGEERGHEIPADVIQQRYES
jgi:hypothetical protein